MPEYVGPMTAWRCPKCGGTGWYKYGVEPPTKTCLMMGCGGTLRRAPELDYVASPRRHAGENPSDAEGAETER